jgi:hypothetical protein
MSYASRHNGLKRRHQTRSHDVNVQRAYDELAEDQKQEICRLAHREARRVLTQEENDRGRYPAGVYECELALERHEQWEALVLKTCASRIQELATEDRGDDGPEERLVWAMGGRASAPRASLEPSTSTTRAAGS